jgi:hypothetical protein
VSDLCALSAHAGVTSVEDRRGFWARCPSAPVPVLLTLLDVGLG